MHRSIYTTRVKADKFPHKDESSVFRKLRDGGRPNLLTPSCWPTSTNTHAPTVAPSSMPHRFNCNFILFVLASVASSWSMTR